MEEKESIQEDYVPQHKEYRQALKYAAAMANSKASVLITGETGAGKEYFADMIVRRSNKYKNPYAKINCAAIPEQLIESELFGHEKGAFTGAVEKRRGRIEAANGGTVFLDEIGDMPFVLQSRLLRVTENNSFNRIGGNVDVSIDVRFISATNVDIYAAINSGKFRKDLYYRLGTMVIEIPSLRKMKSEIRPLATSMFNRLKHAGDVSSALEGFSSDAFDAIENYEWPGNFRELKNKIVIGALRAEGKQITADDIFKGCTYAVYLNKENAMEVLLESFEDLNLEKLERSALMAALRKKSFVQKDAAMILGISARALNYKIAFHEIKHDSWKANSR